MENQPLGKILVEAGLVSLAQIEFALQEQLEEDLKIGEILAQKNLIKQKTADFFVEKWPKLLQAEEKKPLVYYFKKAGLLDKHQINLIIEKQQENSLSKRFHRLAVEDGYLNQTTVDFFLAKLFKIKNNNNLFVSQPYEILRRYIKGERNFSQTNLMKALLIDISLKEIQLDRSNLKEANLTRINLSYSSLIKVNLCLANLAKANLMSVNFEKALLNLANLQESNLEQANFTAASLQEVDLTEAYLFHAFFGSADLRGAKLASEYPYEVYYDEKTIFDDSFNPQQAGWKIKNC
jgi:uncharacterized protein YjbI with pentapeptide repeats